MIRSKLKALCAKHKVKLKEVSRDTGVAYRTLLRIANDQLEQLDLKAFGVLCDYFDCTPGDLFYYEKKKIPVKP